MMMEMIMLFIVIVILCLILGLFTMDVDPVISVVIIMIGIIFCAFTYYGLIEVEYMVVGTNATTGLMEGQIFSTYQYQPYGFVFLALAFIFVMLIFKCGKNIIDEARKTKGEMDIRTK